MNKHTEREDDGVHTSHCCRLHGCKYGDSTCPVHLGKLEQEGPCETCSVCHNIDDIETVRGMIAGTIPVCPSCGDPWECESSLHALAHEPSDPALRERVGVLEKALQFYADLSSWSGRYDSDRPALDAVTLTSGEHQVILGAALVDLGERARQALRGIPCPDSSIPKRR